jgi:hypothetical protein
MKNIFLYPLRCFYPLGKLALFVKNFAPQNLRHACKVKIIEVKIIILKMHRFFNDFDLHNFDFYLEALIVLPQMVLPSK